jgi:predicted nucleic acid-binding protein
MAAETGRSQADIIREAIGRTTRAIGPRLGVDAELALLDDLAVTFTVQALDPAGMKRARDLCARYCDLHLGLADASIVVLAERWSTRSLATFDELHFGTIAPLQGGAFHLLPADA